MEGVFARHVDDSEATASHGDLIVQFIDGTRVFNEDGTLDVPNSCTGHGLIQAPDDEEFTSPDAEARFTSGIASPGCFATQVWNIKQGALMDTPANIGGRDLIAIFDGPWSRGNGAFQHWQVTDDGGGCNIVHIGTLSIGGIIPGATEADPYPQPSFELHVHARSYHKFTGLPIDKGVSSDFALEATPSPAGAYGIRSPGGGVNFEWTW